MVAGGGTVEVGEDTKSEYQDTLSKATGANSARLANATMFLWYCGKLMHLAMKDKGNRAVSYAYSRVAQDIYKTTRMTRELSWYKSAEKVYSVMQSEETVLLLTSRGCNSHAMGRLVRLGPEARAKEIQAWRDGTLTGDTFKAKSASSAAGKSPAAKRETLNDTGMIAIVTEGDIEARIDSATNVIACMYSRLGKDVVDPAIAAARQRMGIR